jgi:hypothetical protein
MKSNLLAQMGQEAMTDSLRVEPRQKRVTPESRMVERAHDAKVSATDRWVRGEMSSKAHDAVHKRADQVIKKKGRK